MLSHYSNKITSHRLYVQLMIPLVELSLRCFGIKNTVRLFIKNKSETTIRNATLADAKRMVRVLKSGVGTAPIKGNCLSRSIVLYKLLKNNKIPAEFCIGVRTKPKFKAHAWIEFEDHPLNAGKKVKVNYSLVNDLILIERASFS